MLCLTGRAATVDYLCDGSDRLNAPVPTGGEVNDLYAVAVFDIDESALLDVGSAVSAVLVRKQQLRALTVQREVRQVY